MNRALVCTCLFALLVASSPAAADSRSTGSLGLGLVVGDPTGLTAEYYPRSPGFGQAVEVTLGLDTFDHGHTYVHVIWKLYLAQLARGRSVDVPIYTGVGPWLAEGGNDDFSLGARIPFGIALDFKAAPLQVFLELAADFQLVHDFDIDVEGAAGFRYYF